METCRAVVRDGVEDVVVEDVIVGDVIVGDVAVGDAAVEVLVGNAV